MQLWKESRLRVRALCILYITLSFFPSSFFFLIFFPSFLPSFPLLLLLPLFSLQVKHMLGSSPEAQTNNIEENTHIANLCDLLERIWGHGLKKREVQCLSLFDACAYCICFALYFYERIIKRIFLLFYFLFFILKSEQVFTLGTLESVW